MKEFLKLIMLVCFVGIFYTSQAQEFSSVEKMPNGLNRIEVIFTQIESVNTAELIISTLRKVDGIKDVELFYPDRTNAYIITSKNVSAEIIIKKLAEIKVELEQKSFKN